MAVTRKAFEQWLKDNLEGLASPLGQVSKIDVTRQAALHFKDPKLAFNPPSWVEEAIQKAVRGTTGGSDLVYVEDDPEEEGDPNLIMGEMGTPDNPEMFLLRLLPPMRDFKFFVAVAVTYRDNAKVAQDYATALAKEAKLFGGHLKCEVNNIANSTRDAFYFFKKKADAKKFASKIPSVSQKKKLTLEEIIVTQLDDPDFSGLIDVLMEIENR